MTVYYDDPHIYQTIAGVDYVTSLGGGRCGRAIGGVVAQLLMKEDVVGWWFLRRTELHIASDVIVPDISGWRHSRMPYIPAVDWFDLRPDWVAEVLTAEVGLLVRKQKLMAYARYGVEYAWIVDPTLNTIDVFRLVDGRWSLRVVHGGDEPARIEPFEAIEFPLATLWLPETPPA